MRPKKGIKCTNQMVQITSNKRQLLQHMPATATLPPPSMSAIRRRPILQSMLQAAQLIVTVQTRCASFDSTGRQHSITHFYNDATPSKHMLDFFPQRPSSCSVPDEKHFFYRTCIFYGYVGYSRFSLILSECSAVFVSVRHCNYVTVQKTKPYRVT